MVMSDHQQARDFFPVGIRIQFSLLTTQSLRLKYCDAVKEKNISTVVLPYIFPIINKPYTTHPGLKPAISCFKTTP